MGFGLLRNGLKTERAAVCEHSERRRGITALSFSARKYSTGQVLGGIDDPTFVPRWENDADFHTPVVCRRGSGIIQF
jgi:hypothetical protein